jgi:hypothetical protein
MSYTAQQCLDRARECEWMGSQALNDNAKERSLSNALGNGRS